MADREKAIKETCFGRDHWSTLLYLETCCVDRRGRIDIRHMRKDGEQYPTRLAKGKLAKGHDDYDCIRDLVAAGYFHSEQEPYRLTDKGWAKVGDFRRARAGANAGGGWPVTDDREKVEKLAQAMMDAPYGWSMYGDGPGLKSYAEAMVAAEEAADWVLHVAHGVGKSGESPTGEEYTEAMDSLKDALAKLRAVMLMDGK